MYHKVRINYYPPRGDNKEGWDNIDIFGWLGYPMQIKVDFLCRDSILAAPLALDLVLFIDLAQRAGLGGIQEWLSFYYKSPQVAPGLYPEHDLFIQLTKLKNTLRWMMGEEQITHLGREYYDDDPRRSTRADRSRGRVVTGEDLGEDAGVDVAAREDHADALAGRIGGRRSIGDAGRPAPPRRTARRGGACTEQQPHGLGALVVADLHDPRRRRATMRSIAAGSGTRRGDAIDERVRPCRC